MKWVVLGAVAVIGGVVLAIYMNRKSSNLVASGKKTSKRPRPDSTGSSGEDSADETAIKGLPDNLKAVIIKSQGELPKVLTPSWLENDLREICLGDSKLLHEFVSALIAASKNDFMAAASIGDEIDADRMEPNKELPAGYRVKKLICPGIRRTKTGEVLMKAVVE